MITEFKAFLQKNNVMALAIGFILGAAVGKVVTATVNDLLMPIIGLAIPSGDWRQIAIPIRSSKLLVGDFLGAVLDFIIIAFAVFMIGKMFLKPEPTPDTKICPHCTEVVAKAASRCKYCTQPV